MEKDTVLLDIEKYNALRDFKLAIEAGNTIVISSRNPYYKQMFITTDQAVAIIAESNKLLKKENEDLRKAHALKANSINDLKKMSYLEWRKWRKS